MQTPTLDDRIRDEAPAMLEALRDAHQWLVLFAATDDQPCPELAATVEKIDAILARIGGA